MNQIMLRSELVGGPFDGDSWSSDWVPHWRQEIGCVRRGSDGSFLWAEYQLKVSKIVYEDGEPCAYFQYQFAGFRESFPTWRVWFTAKFRRLARGCFQRLMCLFKKDLK